MIGVALTSGVSFLSVLEHHRVDRTTGEIRGKRSFGFVLYTLSRRTGYGTGGFITSKRKFAIIRSICASMQSSDLCPIYVCSCFLQLRDYRHRSQIKLTLKFSGVNPAIVGLVLANVLSITSLLSGVVTAFAETEREMVSVERVEEYLISGALQADLDHGGGTTFDNVSAEYQPPFGWPHLGWLKFNNVTLK